jgi:hypothetical protein
MHATASESTPTTDSAGDRATTSRPGNPFASPMSTPMPRAEPAKQDNVPEVKLRWLVAVLIIGTITLLGWIVMMIEFKVRTLN